MKAIVMYQRPPRPSNVPDSLWKLAERCWQDDPRDRPTFAEILTELGAEEEDEEAAVTVAGVTMEMHPHDAVHNRT